MPAFPRVEGGQSSRIERILLLSILSIALLLRLPGLDRWPPAIHQDEASNGVDGYSLWTTGADRAGRSWPVFLEGFGSGDNRTALYAYLTIPGTAAFGPGTVATRLPAALAGVATVLLVYVLVRAARRGATTALATAFLLAVNPWHLYLSRFGHEASITPIFVVAGMALAVRGGSWLRGLAAGVVLGAGIYSYPSFRLFLPVLVGVALLLDAGPERSRIRILSILAGIVLAALPLAIASMAHPERVTARAQSASVLGNVQPLGTALCVIGAQYVEHFLPSFLFVKGDGNPLHSPPGGQLLWAELPLLALGIVAAARRRDRWDRFFLLWFLLYPIASATSLGDRPEYVPHSLRAAVGLPVFQILGSEGLAAAILWLRPKRSARRWVPIAGLAAIGAAIAVNVAILAISFVGPWSSGVARLYHAAYPPAMRTLALHRDEIETAVIECADNPQAYVYAILYGVQTAHEYQAGPKEIVQTETFHLVKRAGPLLYVHDPADMERHRDRVTGSLWFVGSQGQTQAGRLVASFPYPDGSPGIEVRRIDRSR